jgi:hypothetical protein
MKPTVTLFLQVRLGVLDVEFEHHCQIAPNSDPLFRVQERPV